MHADYEKWKEPEGDNAGAHLKRNATRFELRIVGREVVVAVTDGRLDGSSERAEFFGTRERIFFGEFDGQRRKRVLVKIIGE